MAWLGTFDPTLNVTSVPAMSSKTARMYKAFPKTTEEMPHMAPGTYNVRNEEHGPATAILPGDRYQTPSGFCEVPETATNANILPGMYDVGRYEEYMQSQKLLLQTRSATKAREAALRSVGKSPLTKYERDTMEEIANRPILDSFKAEDKQAWSRGINIGSKVRFTPRGGRVRKANPIRYLKRGSGNPSGMQKIAWECGRMRPASRVDRRDRLHFTPGALGPAKEPNKPDIRPKTATAKSQARSPLRKVFTPRLATPVYLKPEVDELEADTSEEEEEVESFRSITATKAKKKAPRLPVHITDISYRVKKMGNLVKSSFESQVSRSPRTNPICGVSETDRNPVIGPGYYYL